VKLLVINNKKISVILERSLGKCLNANVFHNIGIDLIINSNLFIEVKSSYTFSNYSCRYRNQNYRYSHYSFKPNELLGYSDYYIFVEKKNKIRNFNYIKSLEIFIIKTSILKKYFKKLKKDFTKRLQVSVNTIKKIKYLTLNNFIENLESERI